MHNMKRRVMGSMMAVLMGASTILGTCPTPLFAADAASIAEEITVGATDVDASNSYGLVSATEGNILHAWDWKFTDVTKSIEDIAEAGYSLVQVSPCQVCESASTNNDWWKLYQPYDYKFGNSLGSEAEFKEMCATAEEYGISIIVDVVANHMAGTGTGTCGERKSEVDPWWTNDKFHNENVKFTGDFDNDRNMMVLSNIGMPDVNTGSAEVQQRMVTYLEKMLDMGADGFRYDAAKHIGTTSDSGRAQDTFWQTISKAVAAKRPDALVYGEILNAMPVSDEYYVKDGIKVTESQKGWDMKDLVRGEAEVSQKTAFTYTRKSSADKLITWVENHDTYLNHWGSTGLADFEEGNHKHKNYMSDDQIMLAWSTVGARADAQALYFARPDGCEEPDNPNNPDASNKIKGNLGMSTKNFDWKDTKVASVNKFKNAMVGVGETTSVENGLAIIKRGNKGLVVTNFGSGSKNVDVSGLTGLADGTYKDASGQNGSFTVSGGKVTGEVKGKSFAVIYDADAVVTATTAPTKVPVTETEAPTQTPTESGTETDVPTTPIVTDEQKEVTVAADKADCSFLEAFDVKVTAANAAKAFYSYDGADWVEFEGTATVAVGKEELVAGDQVGLFLVAFDNEGQMIEKSYTYTKGCKTIESITDVDVAKFEVRVSKDEFATAPTCYVYTDEKKDIAGEWPGATMVEEGNYWVYKNDSITSATIILKSGDWRSTEDQKPGLTVTGAMDYSKATNTLKAIEGTTTQTTEAPTGTKKPAKPAANPVFEITVTDAPVDVTETPDVPENTPETTETEAPVEAPSISVDQVSGTEFDDETLAVKIKLQNATEGTYTIDSGVVKKFTDEVTVEVGEGKIADTDVTLQVTAVNGDQTATETYTYKKVFNASKAAETQTAKKPAVVTIKNLMEVVADAAQVDAGLSGAPTTNYFSTNPGKQSGSKKTITKAADFTEDMIIAQGVANDGIISFRGTHEGPVYDTYAMYGAYDDKNVYIGVQYVNVIDVIDPAQGYPISDNGKPNAGDIPQMMVFDTRSGDYTDGTANDVKQKTAWDTNVKFGENAKVDKVFVYSAKAEVKNTAFFPVTNGIVDYTKVMSSKEGTDSGITYTYEDGFFSKNMYGIKGHGGDGYKPEDLNDENANWIDFLTTSHDTQKDTFMIMTVPMSTLGVTASDVESNGIGVMSISTFGASGIGSLPQDLSMLDVATKEYSADPSTSAEKEDEDLVTTALAQLGGTVTEGGDRPIIKTPAPATSTPEIADPDESAVPATPEVEETVTPDVTVSDAPVVEETAIPDTTDVPVVEETPEVNPSATPAVVDKTETDKMVVNFGANLSAPQAAGCELTLEAKPQNASGECEYEFTVDGTVIREYASDATCAWTATDGVHTIAVAVKDSEGNVLEVAKKYTAEAVGDVVEATKIPTTNNGNANENATAAPTMEVTAAPATEVPIVNNSEQNPTATPVITNAPTTVINNNQVVNAGVSQMKVDFVFGLASPQKKGTKISISPKVEGGSGAYTYKVTASLQGSSQVDTIAENVSGSAVSTWTPAKEGTYALTLTVTDSKDKTITASKTRLYDITGNAKLAIKKVKVNKKKVKLGKKVKISANGTASTGKLKFRFVAKKGSKKTTIKKFSTAKTCTWKPAKVGTYKIVVTAKDGSGKSVSKTVKVKVVK